MGQDNAVENAKTPSPAAASPAAAAAAASEPNLDTAQAIEPATGPGEEDEFDLTEGYETGSSASTTATSSVWAHTYEHGRRYSHFKNGRYPIPNDDEEQNREDMKHAMLLEVMDGRLFYAPVGPAPQMVLDIGTGTGIWAIDMGDKFPSARVRGIDLSPIQPVWLPPNVDFLVDDAKQPWLERDCDLIHLRFATTMISPPSALMENAMRALRPGGWLELQELNAWPMCDDGTMAEDDPVKKLYELIEQAFGKFGMDSRLAEKLGPMITEGGLVNLQCVVKKVPIGVWARDKTMRLIGLYQKLAVLDFLPSVAGRPFAALGLSEAQIQVTLALARKGMEDSNVHRYFNYYFWYAQKPEEASEAPG